MNSYYAERTDDLLKLYKEQETYRTDGSPKSVRRLIDESFEEILSYIEAEDQQPSTLEFLGFSPQILLRRKQALAKYMLDSEDVEDRKEKHELHPDALAVLYAEMQYDYYYDHIYVSHNMEFAAALWILDELRLAGHIEDIYQYLPPKLGFIEYIYFPDEFNDLSFDLDLIRGVVFVLRRRYGFFDLRLISDFTASGKQRTVYNSGSEDYRNIMSLIPGERIEAAREAYLRKSYDLIQLMCDGYELLEKDKTRLWNKYKENLSVLKTMQSHLYRFSENDEDKLNELEEFALSFEDQMEEIIDNQKRFPLLCYKKLTGDDASAIEEIRQNIGRGKDARLFLQKLEEFEVGDPFATCFALMYLIDQDTDAPWLFSIGSVLLTCAAHKLPWSDRARGLLHPDEYFAEQDDLASEEHKLENAVSKIEEYHTKKQSGKTLAQMIYNISGVILPRYLSVDPEHKDALTAWGTAPEDAERITELISLLSASQPIENTSYLEYLLDMQEDEDEDEAEADQELLDDDGSIDADVLPGDPGSLYDEIEALKSELKHYKDENKELRRSHYEQIRENRKQIVRLEQEVQDLQQEHLELTDLREYYYNHGNVPEDSEADQLSVNFPYETKNMVVVVGGHESFVHSLRDLLPTVRFINPEGKAFDHNIIRNADMIFIQNNRIGHAQFYSVIAEARKNKKVIHYFNYASARKSAEQLAIEDMKLEKLR